MTYFLDQSRVEYNMALPRINTSNQIKHEPRKITTSTKLCMQPKLKIEVGIFANMAIITA